VFPRGRVDAWERVIDESRSCFLVGAAASPAAPAAMARCRERSGGRRAALDAAACRARRNRG